MDLSRKQIYIIGGLVLFVLLITAVGLWGRRSAEPPSAAMDVLKEGSKNGAPADYSTTIPLNAVATPPVASAPAAPNSKSQLGFFDMTVDSAGFHPASLVVRQNDVVQIRVTAVGGNYDMAIPGLGMYNTMKKGETKQFTFSPPNVGTYLFECRDMCPFARKIQGSIVVMK